MFLQKENCRLEACYRAATAELEELRAAVETAKAEAAGGHLAAELAAKKQAKAAGELAGARLQVGLGFVADIFL